MATRISAATLDSEGDGEMILQLKQDNADLRRRLEESLKRRHVLECAQIDHDTTVSRLQWVIQQFIKITSLGLQVMCECLQSDYSKRL